MITWSKPLPRIAQHFGRVGDQGAMSLLLRRLADGQLIEAAVAIGQRGDHQRIQSLQRVRVLSLAAGLLAD